MCRQETVERLVCMHVFCWVLTVDCVRNVMWRVSNRVVYRQQLRARMGFVMFYMELARQVWVLHWQKIYFAMLPVRFLLVYSMLHGIPSLLKTTTLGISHQVHPIFLLSVADFLLALLWVIGATLWLRRAPSRVWCFAASLPTVVSIWVDVTWPGICHINTPKNECWLLCVMFATSNLIRNAWSLRFFAVACDRSQLTDFTL